jgi:predicted O-methyltransferase YrrM
MAEGAVSAYLRENPRPGVQTLGSMLKNRERLATASLPRSLNGFEDLAFLFAPTMLAAGIAILTVREAAYLYRCASRVSDGAIVEIGRFKGGSTLVIAAAMGPHAHVYSYDLGVKMTDSVDHVQLRDELTSVLEKFGMAERCHPILGDSRTAERPDDPIRLVFVDGDHSYEGARADYERWAPLVAPGGALLFHDAIKSQDVFRSWEPGVARVVRIAERDGWERVGEADSIVELRRRERIDGSSGGP